MTTDHPQTNSSVRYQYVMNHLIIDADALVVFPVRDTWEEAAADAISVGQAEWVRSNELRLVSGEIKRVRK